MLTLKIVAAAMAAMAMATPAMADGDAAHGEALAFDRAKGNCLACHTMKGTDVAGNVGPELNDMKARFPKAGDLAAILQDEETRNPQTVMPAFGKNLILSDQEMRDIVAYLYTL